MANDFPDVDLDAGLKLLPNPKAALAQAQETNPDQAAEAVRLSKTTGAPAPVIAQDVDGFKQRVGQAAGNQIIGYNPQLQQYITSDEMKAKVSHDDLAALSTYSDAQSNMPQESVFGAVARGFKTGFDWKGYAEETSKLDAQFPLWRNNINPLIGAVDIVADRGPAAVFGGLTAGLQHFLGEKTGAEISEFAQVAMMAEGSAPHHMSPEMEGLNHQAQIAQKAAPYLQAGKEIPRGLIPEIDAARKQQGTADFGKLKEAFQAAQATQTRERVPEFFRDFAAQHVGERTIGISSEVASALYGDKIPAADDGLLGFVPDMAHQLEVAKETGSDVQVPIADMMAHMDPEVFKAVEEGVRTDPEGFTKTEESRPGVDDARRPPAIQGIDGLSPETLKKGTLPTEETGLIDAKHFSPDELRQLRGMGLVEVGYKRGDAHEGVDPSHLLNEAQRRSSTDNYPPTGIGEVYNGFYSVRSQEIMKDTGAAGPHDVPEWYHPLKSTVDELADSLGLKTTPSLWVGKNADKSRYGYASSDGHIVLREDIPRDDAVATVLHELGHQVQYQKFYELDHGQQSEITRAWQRDRANKGGDSVAQWRPLTSDKDPSSGVALPYTSSTYRDYVKSFPEWFAEQTQRWLTKNEVPANAVDKFFKGIADAWRKIYERVTGHHEVAPEMNKFLSQIWQGEALGDRPGYGPRPIEPGGPVAIPVRPEGIRIFTAPDAIGMTKDHWVRYEKAIAKQHEENYQAALAKATKAEKLRQTLEWKQNRNKTMAAVIEDFDQMPRFKADRDLREATDPREKIGTDYLTEEEKAALPRKYQAKNGSHPDRLAGYFGYDTGAEMVRDLADLHKNRGEISPAKYITDLVEKETDRRMEAAHGDLGENILAAAKEQTLRETALDTMHAELEAMAADHKWPAPFSKEQVLAHVLDKLSNMRMAGVSSDAFIRNLMKIDHSIEDALLKGDPQAAFRQRQMKYMTSVYAKEAAKIEKIKKTFDKTAKTFRDREVTGVRQEYTDQIHGILQRMGEKVKRSSADIAANMEKAGFRDLEHFAQQKGAEGRDLEVPGFMLDDWRKPVAQMTTDEFKDTAALVKTLRKYGRDENQVLMGAERQEKSIVMTQMLANLKEIRDTPREYQGHTPEVKKTLRSQFSAFGWSLVNIEAICKRLDKGDPNGVFTQAFARPAIRGMNYRDTLVKEIARDVNDIGDFKDLHKQVDNMIFKRPDEEPGFLPMTRNHVIAVLSHMGNADNFARLTEGHGVSPEAVKSWVARHTTKDDWDKMQKIGKVYDKLFELADRMSYDVREIGIRKLDLGVVDNPHGGAYSGWYNPVAHDMDALKRPKIGEPAMPPEVTATGIDGMQRYSSMTDQRYTKQRTSYRAPILLDTAIIPMRMQQMIHDIAMRPAILQLNKFVNDPQFRANVRNYYGPEAAEMMQNWVRDLAGASDANPATLTRANGLIHQFLRNTAAAEIGFGVSTIMKHTTTALSNSILQVGPGFARAVLEAGKEGPIADKSWAQFAMTVSEELKRRSRFTPEALTPQVGLKFPGADATPWGKAKQLAEDVRQYGTAGVALGDLASAVPTWIAEYRKWEGRVSRGETIDRADAAVREAHGSSALTNRPEFVRQKNPLAQGFTQFYGFFNEMLQKNYEMAWRAKDAWGSAWEGDYASAVNDTKRAGNILARMVVAGLIEETVSGGGDPKEGWMSKAVKGTFHAFGATLPLVRDLIQAFASGHDPQGSLFAAGIKSFSDIGRDVTAKQAWTKPWANKFLRDTGMLAATVSGVPVNHPVRAGEFFYNYFHHTEHPQGPMDFARGISRGTVGRH